MTHAYGECYLDDAMSNLGEAFDYSANACNVTLDEFMKLFIASGYAEQFESGTPKAVAGLSGSELVLAVLEATGKQVNMPDMRLDYDCSPEYWCGYILAYYQWHSSLRFREIVKYISMRELMKMYGTLHEASEEKAIDTFNSMIRRKATVTRLATLRKNRGISQKELAERAGISLRSVQQYEQRGKDINKASLDTVLSIASVLGCKPDDLAEPTVVQTHYKGGGTDA